MNQLNEIKSSNTETVQANYNKLSEHIRRLTPHGIQCSVFCGGVNCKYENPENWKPDSLALQGIYSHWVTDDILAMARPSTMVIIQRNIIQQFESLGIKSIINLQSPREHASCGQPLESSGFSYNPNVFMEDNIFYYNFAWKDYGDATLEGLLNMVKVLAFALTEGRVAIHCHAGLGRTGVLIACYLVYALRVSANEAIRYVRLKRPGSVQTRGQILCVRHFAQFILPQTVTYYLKDNISKDKHMNEFNLHKFLKRQRVVLHGYEERNFKYLPKIVFVLCQRILKLCECYDDDANQPANVPFTTDYFTEKLHGTMKRQESTFSIASLASPTSETIFLNPSNGASTPSSPNPSENGDTTDSFSEISTLDGDEMREELLLENRCFQELETQKSFVQEQADIQSDIRSVDDAVDAILTDFYDLDADTRNKIKEYENDINSSRTGWLRLTSETNLYILTSLLFDWLEKLKAPIITIESFENIVILYKQPEECFKKFGMEEAYLIEHILLFLIKLRPINEESRKFLLKRFLAALSKHSININEKIIPSDKGFKRIGGGTLACTVDFFQSLSLIIENHHKQRPMLYTMDEITSDNETDLQGFQ
ncbi:protein tyrosine phosphatase domain-containing protein 1-like [Cylas formicarius]|uniref:protein tyrosine phosphatase domain-containing protein 1-like n=1 Tax=Cylas formicarius TaxID=197179 RepID=UPI002958A281|nr:protein tyrosine phosphatase domain-containing protein 1-like [Cylas formicarius]